MACLDPHTAAAAAAAAAPAWVAGTAAAGTSGAGTAAAVPPAGGQVPGNAALQVYKAEVSLPPAAVLAAPGHYGCLARSRSRPVSLDQLEVVAVLLEHHW